MRQRPHRLVGAEQGPGLGDVELVIRFKAPGVEADGDVVGQQVGGGEVEVDQSGDVAFEEEHVVREQVGMDVAARQVAWPCGKDRGQRVGQHGSEPRFDLVRTVEAALQQRPPPARAQGVGAGGDVAAAGDVEPGQRGAEGAAMLRPHPARPHAGEEGGDAGGAAGQGAQAVAVPAADRQRAGDPLPRQVLHQAEEPRQLRGVDALFVEGEDVVAGGGAELVVAVLHPLGDAAEGDDGAEVIAFEEDGQRLVGNLRIDGHVVS